MKYRPEIDGLRALAVLPVILFHSGFEWFSGGFVGVDIFFVISGYVVSGMLLAELTSTGKLDMYKFYGRRFKRLLPNASYVMLFVLLTGLLIVPLKTFAQWPDCVQWASLFSGNVYYYRSHTDYWSSADGMYVGRKRGER